MKGAGQKVMNFRISHVSDFRGQQWVGEQLIADSAYCPACFNLSVSFTF